MSVSRKLRGKESSTHVVYVYERDGDLVEAAGRYLFVSLAAGDAAVIVAREAHRVALERDLERRGIDLERAAESGRFMSVDAAELMSTFQRSGIIDRDLFNASVGGILRAMLDSGHPVRVFGEMVALLWEQGDALGAIELETCWNELGSELPFSLFCSYAATSLAEVREPPFGQVCDLHTAVLGDCERRRAGPSGEPKALRALFDAHLTSPRLARRLCSAALAEWGHEGHILDDAALVVTELATNAVRHAESSFRLVLDAEGEDLRIAVRDNRSPIDAGSQERLPVVPGHGLAMIDDICARWGVLAEPGGKVVWAELPLPAHASQG